VPTARATPSIRIDLREFKHLAGATNNGYFHAKDETLVRIQALPPRGRVAQRIEREKTPTFTLISARLNGLPLLLPSGGGEEGGVLA